MLAYVLIAVDAGHEKTVFEQLKATSGVKDAHMLFGEWDVIVKAEVPNAEALGPFVLNTIRGIKGVKLTSTMIVAD
ncbi:MAG: Lrp/AsnC ligand binding domain-containing protein [Candidatus Woesearchaeota archaeon]